MRSCEHLGWVAQGWAAHVGWVERFSLEICTSEQTERNPMPLHQTRKRVVDTFRGWYRQKCLVSLRSLRNEIYAWYAAQPNLRVVEMVLSGALGVAQILVR